jgi:hypothetical protein
MHAKALAFACSSVYAGLCAASDAILAAETGSRVFAPGITLLSEHTEICITGARLNRYIDGNGF